MMINLGRRNGRVLVGDLCDVNVGVYVSFNNQVPRFDVDGAKIANLFCKGWSNAFIGQEGTGWKPEYFWSGPNWATLRPPP